MTPQEKIEQMLLNNDEFLCGYHYEEIVTSDYDNIVSILNQAIDAYKQTELYDYEVDDLDTLLGTEKDKMNALANYLRHVADQIEEKD